MTEPFTDVQAAEGEEMLSVTNEKDCVFSSLRFAIRHNDGMLDVTDLKQKEPGREYFVEKEGRWFGAPSQTKSDYSLLTRLSCERCY
jgi:hypothetical protein